MDFWLGIFTLAYGVAGLWAVTANDYERRNEGVRPGEPRLAVRRVDVPSQG